MHTKLPTVMSVYVTPGWLHSKQCLFTPDWASSRTLRAQTSWLSRCFRFDILQPPPAAPPAPVSPGAGEPRSLPIPAELRYIEHLTPRIMQNALVRVFAVCQKQRRRRGVKLAGWREEAEVAAASLHRKSAGRAVPPSCGSELRWPVPLKIPHEIISCYLITVSTGRGGIFHWIQ